MNKLQDSELKKAFLVCGTILGVISMIGIYWGKDGTLALGSIFLFLILCFMFAATISGVDK